MVVVIHLNNFLGPVDDNVTEPHKSQVTSHAAAIDVRWRRRTTRRRRRRRCCGPGSRGTWHRRNCEVVTHIAVIWPFIVAVDMRLVAVSFVVLRVRPLLAAVLIDVR